ncbi:hypothetical protein LLG39_08680, partial [bacterium]|nr:hypothetical protein [bacterium]
MLRTAERSEAAEAGLEEAEKTTFRIIYRFGLSLIRCFAAFGGGFGSFAVRSNYARRLTFD